MKLILALFITLSLRAEEFYMQPDKQKHFLGSVILAIVFYALTQSIVGAIVISLGIGAVKELYHDLYLNKGTPDWYDMLANSLGVIFGIILVLIFEAIRML
jgi:VanZ family protein